MTDYKPISILVNDDGSINTTPTFLFDHDEMYKEDPKGACLAWFKEAQYGLGVNFGLHALIGRGERIQQQDKIAVNDYASLMKRFTADNFNAVDIVEFAIAAGARYISFPARDMDGFCLFNSEHTDFTSAKSAAQRDLVAELASVCEFHGVGLCLKYSHGRDWHHPHAPTNQEWKAGPRPDYPIDSQEDSRLEEYCEFMEAQIKELLSQYGPIAAIQLEGIDVPLSGDKSRFQCEGLYICTRMQQPQVLISYEQGLLGTEDFFSLAHRIPEENSPQDVQGFIYSQTEKPLELRTTMTPDAWGYFGEKAGSHLKEAQIWDKFTEAVRQQANFTISTALMPDGSLDMEDIQTLLAVGERIEKNGFPR